MNTQTTVPTLRQRQALAAYNDARREAIYYAERTARSLHREAMHAPPKFPSMQPMPRRPTFVQQIAAECRTAPMHMLIGVAMFFGAGIGVTIAIFMGWV